MKVIITSDGSVGGTKITTQGGEDITDKVQAISYREEGGQLPRVDLELFFIEFKATAEARMLGPGGKAVARIIYEDGSEDVFTDDGVRAVSRPMLDGRMRHFKDPSAGRE